MRDILAAGSWNGLKVIKACQLASFHSKLLDLRALCATDPYTSYDYAYGYLVATAAVGMLGQQSNPTDGKIKVTHFFEITRISLDSEIHARIARSGKEAEWKAEIAAIENFVSVAPSLPSPPTESPPGGQKQV